MARLHGKNAVLSFNAVDLSDELNQITMNVTVPEADITSFSDVYSNALAGKKSITTEIAGSLDMATGAGDKTLFEAFGAGAKSLVIDPTGAGPGANDPEYQCTASGLSGVLVANYSISMPVGGAASYTASLQHSGLTTRAVA